SCHRLSLAPVHPWSRASDASASGGQQILCSTPARAVVAHDLEGQLLALDDGAHAGPLHGGNVNEDVRAASVGLNEAEALGCVEELYGSGVHLRFLSIGKVIPSRATICNASWDYIEIEEEDRLRRKL